jgi:hypothetical protein
MCVCFVCGVLCSHSWQVADHCHRFIAIGEAFTGCELPQQREALGQVLGSAFETQHQNNMEALSALAKVG